MNNEDFTEEWKYITDPTTALEIIIGNETYFGYDPYYSDIREALLNMAKRIIKNKGK